MPLTLPQLSGVLVLLAAAAASVPAAAKERESFRTIDVADFTVIDISGVYGLDVLVGEEFSFQLSGSDAQLEGADVQRVGRTLKLRTNKGFRNADVRRKEASVRAIIRMPALEGLRISGVAGGSVKGIEGDRFDLDISGVAHIDLSGACSSMRAELSGVGDVKASGLRCKSVHVDVSGVGSAWVFASEEIDASVSGVGKLRISGDPAKVNKRYSGFLSTIVMD